MAVRVVLTRQNDTYCQLLGSGPLLRADQDGAGVRAENDVVGVERLTVRPLHPAPEPEDAAGASLTDRERDVLDLLVQGVTSNRDLAEKLFVSENTVKYHLRNILYKLHLKNRAQVVAYAMRHGLVDPNRGS